MTERLPRERALCWGMKKGTGETEPSNFSIKVHSCVVGLMKKTQVMTLPGSHTIQNKPLVEHKDLLCVRKSCLSYTEVTFNN